MNEPTLNQTTTPQFKLVDVFECPTCKATCPDGAILCESCNASLKPKPSEPVTIDEAVPLPALSLPRGACLQNDALIVGEVLGQGGFGITYKSTEAALHRFVAIKEFFPAGSSRQGKNVLPPPDITPEKFVQMRSRFMKEAQILARFNHSGIVRVFSSFEENNTAYMVMELLAGRSLQALLDETQPMSDKEAVRIITQVGNALSAVHERSFLHRDIKPENIILTDDGRVVLIDFGSARVSTGNNVQTMTTMVSPGYAPLEQYSQQAEIGPYIDVYALAATLYYCLTKKLPASAMDRMSGVDLLAPKQLRVVGDAISDAAMRGLEIRAEDRPQTVTEFLKELQVEQGKTPVSTPPATPAPLVGNSCAECGVSIFNDALVCSNCRRKERTSSIGSNPELPLSSRPDTPFDTFMSSIPSWAWTIFWVVTLLLIVGRIGLGVMRYQNGSRDFSEQLMVKIKNHPKAKQLREVKLEQGEGVLDKEKLVKRYDDYVGTVRYKNGDVGILALGVTKRDWFYRPENFKFSYGPKDFGDLIAGQIRSEINGRLARQGIRLRVTSISLTRRSRTKYEGQYIIDNDFKSPIGISATVLDFNKDGEPYLWTYMSE